MSYTKHLLFSLLLLSCTLLVQAQGNLLWSKNYGGSAADIAEAIIQTSDNGLLLVGYTFSNNQDISSNQGSADVWVLKTDMEGNPLWSKTFGSAADEVGYSVVETDNNQYIIAGTSTNNGNKDAYVLQIDANGNLLWEQFFGGTKMDAVTKIIASNDSNFLLTGTTHSQISSTESSFGQADIWVLNINASGDLLWQKNYGGGRSDLAKDIVQLNDGSIFLSGKTFSQDGLFQNNSNYLDDSFILKLTANGDFIWSQKYGSNIADGFQAIEKSNDGKLVALGFEGIQNTTISGIQGRYDQDLLLQAINTNGQAEWSNTLGGTRYDSGIDLTATSDGGYLICANTHSFNGDSSGSNGLQDKWVVKVNAFGVFEWQKGLGGSNLDEAKAVIQANNGHYYILGNTLSDNGNLSNNKGNKDFYLTKIEGSFVLSLSLGADVDICQGESVFLTPNIPNCVGCSYLWNDGNTDANRTINPSSTSTYSLTITDQEGNIASDAQTITVHALPSVAIEQSNLLCYGGSTGAITLTPTAGTPPFAYEWSTGATTASLQNLVANTYKVTISDAHNCSSIESITLEQGAPILIAFETQNVACNGAETGQITTQIQGGNEPYNFLWNNGNETQNLTNIPAANYQLTITDNNNCSQTQNVEITQAESIEIDFTTQNIGCNGSETGQITTQIQGGNQPYNFLWNNGNETQNLTNIPAANYQLTITDNNNCSQTQNVEITQAEPIEIDFTTQNIGCNGSETGQITTQIQGGNQPYNFLWNNGNETQNLTNIPAANYQLTITDNNNCSQTQNVEITQAEPIEIDFTTQNIGCNGGETGQITTQIQGGNQPYNFLWNNGNETQNLTNIPAANYQLTITDNNNCSQSQSVEITQAEPIEIDFTTQNIGCNGGETGQITTQIQGGNQPYNFLWNNGNETQNLTNIPAANYQLTITDNNNCSQTQNVEITQAEPIEIDFTTQNIGCNGGETGQITTQIQGGNQPYNFLWNNGNETQNLTNIPAANYQLTITDNNNCSQTQNVEITQAEAISITFETQDVNCHGDTTGQIIPTIEGGVQPFSYLWSNGNENDLLSNVVAGMYEITITDTDNCTQTAATEIIEAPAISINFQAQNSICFGDSTGQILTEIQGGIPPYNFLWNNGNETQNLEHITGGTYELIVVDATNCVETQTQVVTTSDPIIIEAAIDSITCFGEANASIDLAISGGTGDYQINWDSGANTTSIDGLSAGTYNATILDDNDCTQSANFELVEPDSLSAIVAMFQPLENNSNGSIQLDVLGGTMPYLIEWSNGIQSDSLNNLPAGTYLYTVIDANNCVLLGSVVLENMVATNTLSDNKQIEISPNPSSGKLFFKTTEILYSDIDVSVFSVSGKRLLSKKISGQDTWSIDLDNLPAGTYFIKLSTPNFHQIEKIVLIGN